MVLFEISVNGEALEPMHCEDCGSLLAIISWYRGRQNSGEIYDNARLAMSGVRIGRDTPYWPSLDLSIGDEITIRIIERQAPEMPPGRKLFSN